MKVSVLKSYRTCEGWKQQAIVHSFLGSKRITKTWGDCWRYADGKPCPSKVELAMESLENVKISNH